MNFDPPGGALVGAPSAWPEPAGERMNDGRGAGSVSRRRPRSPRARPPAPGRSATGGRGPAAAAGGGGRGPDEGERAGPRGPGGWARRPPSLSLTLQARKPPGRPERAEGTGESGLVLG